MEHRNKTRLAPTPSGYLHLGNILSFIITETLAQQHGAKVWLRIDDLDRERAEPRYVTDIIDTLHFLDMPYDEGPADVDDFAANYSQVWRMPLYNQLLGQLAENGHLFACTCSRADVWKASPDDGRYLGTCLHKQLPLDTPGATWRLNTSAPLELKMLTPKGYTTQLLPGIMQHFVVRKKNAFAAYQLSSVADDAHHGADLIVRGEDLNDSTLAQLYLAQRLNLDSFSNALFYHHPLVMNSAGEKLSKSAGDTSIQWMRQQGATASEIYQTIGALAGIKPRNDWRETGKELIDKYWQF